MSIHAVHLVGSVPLHDAEQVFRTVSARLGDNLRRIPDGETDGRADWTSWHRALFDRTPGLVADKHGHAHGHAHGHGGPARYRLSGGPGDLRFGELGHAAAARTSWQVFQRLRAEGVLPDLRFQVCLPTPVAPVALYVDPCAQAAVEPAYEAAVLRELRLIADVVPHDRLSVQWDTSVEFGMLEGVVPSWFPDVEDGVLNRLSRLFEAVPADAEVGYHLCYSDPDHGLFAEPRDAGRLVAVANALTDRLVRRVGWIHLPVPAGRTDPAYYAPLHDLWLPIGTELYLGLVHAEDGLDGARHRIEAARTVVSAFGVAAACGLGGYPPEAVPGLLDLHAAVAALSD
ncbi:hypothetical protein [Nonomuraea maritima]|uniref:hypothetical protein n=1 Tax=Nonomuraea maritima TaxID=683260 RepID=UPI003720B03E